MVLHPPTSAALLLNNFGDSTAAVAVVSLSLSPAPASPLAGARDGRPLPIPPGSYLVVEWWNSAAERLLGLRASPAHGDRNDLNAQRLLAVDPALCDQVMASLLRLAVGADAGCQALSTSHHTASMAPCSFTPKRRAASHRGVLSALVRCFRPATATDAGGDGRGGKGRVALSTVILQLQPSGPRLLLPHAAPAGAVGAVSSAQAEAVVPPRVLASALLGPGVGGGGKGFNDTARLGGEQLGAGSCLPSDLPSDVPTAANLASREPAAAEGAAASLSARLGMLTLAQMPLCVTAFTPAGCILHQNAASAEYFGRQVATPTWAATIPVPTAGIAAAVAGIGLTRGVPWSSAAAAGGGDGGGGDGGGGLGAMQCGGGDTDVLAQLFALEPGKLKAMLACTLEAERGLWEGILRVPGSLNPNGPEASHLLPSSVASGSLDGSATADAVFGFESGIVAAAVTALSSAGLPGSEAQGQRTVEVMCEGFDTDANLPTGDKPGNAEAAATADDISIDLEVPPAQGRASFAKDFASGVEGMLFAAPKLVDMFGSGGGGLPMIGAEGASSGGDRGAGSPRRKEQRGSSSSWAPPPEGIPQGQVPPHLPSRAEWRIAEEPVSDRLQPLGLAEERRRRRSIVMLPSLQQSPSARTSGGTRTAGSPGAVGPMSAGSAMPSPPPPEAEVRTRQQPQRRPTRRLLRSVSARQLASSRTDQQQTGVPLVLPSSTSFTCCAPLAGSPPPGTTHRLSSRTLASGATDQRASRLQSAQQSPRVLKFAYSLWDSSPAAAAGRTTAGGDSRNGKEPGDRSARPGAIVSAHSASANQGSAYGATVNSNTFPGMGPPLGALEDASLRLDALYMNAATPGAEHGRQPLHGSNGGGGIDSSGIRERAGRSIAAEAQRLARWSDGGESVYGDGDDDGDDGTQHVAEAWHEVRAVAATDPLTRQRYLVVVQKDVTEKIEAERHIAQVSEAQHRLLEQVFPRHVLSYLTRQSFDVRHKSPHLQPPPPSAATVAATSATTGSAAAPIGAPWRPHVRDCTHLATWHGKVTVLFADIQGFTPLCGQLPAVVVMKLVHDLFVRFDELLDAHGVYKVETIGDCYVVAGGLVHEDAGGMSAVRDSGEDPQQAERVFAFARAMLHAAAQVTLPTTGQPVRIRVGIHSGPLVSGVVGTRMPRFCLFGDTINTASRMESTGTPGCVHVSEETVSLGYLGVHAARVK
ncbi:Guanylate cyclase soluble subunit beta-2 [Tetrabaena socialis]|uniref:Guanylate cyclase soluble subunit beta-2 n=1 Tax=Tetrabaena socialis TaxID=47790 RepID=A0A2J7ZS58_9CHLO|nr:Guanylate cyclase soluble subunit beta-2 [Tetrabaena socialis]|eukprot:PNH03104.1 Guanylate cyclase soluble subunit beta-2 [Tetrabaena socialis]